MREWFAIEKQFSFEQMSAAFSYDALSGRITWRANRGNSTEGKCAGWVNLGGYRVITFGSVRLMAHRLAWLLHYGIWPEISIDHRNLSKDDNRIENLRLATRAQNQANRRAHKTNKCGFKNVCFRPLMKKKWEARIAEGKKQRIIGYFDTAEGAHAAYVDAAKRLHGEFARAA